MKLLSKGKERLKKYVSDMQKLRKQAQGNALVLEQIAALEAIMKSLYDAWDISFEASVIAHSKANLKHYEVVNAGSGSWAVAIGSDVGYQLAALTKTLFEDIAANLDSYVHGLPIQLLSIEITTPSLKVILNNAVNQIDGIMKFYQYVVKFESPMPDHENVNYEQYLYKMFSDSVLEVDIPASTLAKLLKELINNYSSSYLHTAACRFPQNGIVIFPTNTTIQYLGTLIFNNLIEHHAHLMLSKSQAFTKIEWDYSPKWSNFEEKLKFAKKEIEHYLLGKHEPFKMEIMQKLGIAIVKKLEKFPSLETLHIFYNQKYDNLYKEHIKYTYFQKNHKDLVIVQKQHFFNAVEIYLDFLDTYVNTDEKEFKLRQKYKEFAVAKTSITSRTLLSNIEDFINTMLTLPAGTLINQLLQEVTELNQLHTAHVLSQRNAFGESGDIINNLYALLLETLADLTMIEEPHTFMKLKLMDNLYPLLSEEELATTPTISVTETLSKAGGSPLHSALSSHVEKDSEFQFKL